MNRNQRLFFTPTLAVGLTLLLSSCVTTKQEESPPAVAAQTAALKGSLFTRVNGDLEVCQTQTVDSSKSDCEQRMEHEELCQPIEFTAESNNVLITKLDVAKKYQCVTGVPADEGDPPVMSVQKLRNYGYFDEKEGWNYNFPGPTFRMKRAVPTAGIEGDRFKMLLTNSMGETTTGEQMKCFPGKDQIFSDDEAPNCFHGNEVTNFHFHGFHVSPQPLQDYVLLKLYPKNTPGIEDYNPNWSNDELRGYEEIGGAYRYDVDPLPYNQPEGTHWYHAHNHGATAQQVINGMAGTFLVEGPFDEWLDEHYARQGSPKLRERLMVIQQIGEGLESTGVSLVNGQLTPHVPIRPGEVQRWRFVSATTQASAQLSVQFGDTLSVCQIQMDGVRFSPENYQRQPLLEGNCSNGEGITGAEFELSPGNRADFLVRMPPETTLETLREEPMMITTEVISKIGTKVKQRIKQHRERLRGLLKSTSQDMLGSTSLPLMSIKMQRPDSTTMEFPKELPPMPGFLRPPSPTITKPPLDYEMFGKSGTNPKAPIFKINGMQVQKEQCVPEDLSVTRGVDEKWIVRNRWAENSDQPTVPAFNGKPRSGRGGIPHPFHIHTNPFYVVRNGNVDYTKDCRPEESCGIWQDTIALPLADSEGDSNADRDSSVELHMEFEDYTGGYVQHCHILGHEDRGMMTLVQTLCPDSEKFGTPIASEPDQCDTPLEPLPLCAP
jgi:FtsP/CotA-like multicopper oxidase with cupredoxin domain